MAFIKTRKKIVSSAIASTLSVVAVNAMAQEPTTQLDTIHSEATTEQTRLKVDNSKNTKFVAPLLDTAKSVSVIAQQLIKDTQVTTLADALRTVPGITLGAGEGGNPNGDRPFIRGYNSESSMYVDGVRGATSQNREMFAVEQVEVTKGSSSTQGGAATTGGSINMISKLAKKGDSLEGSVATGTDNYQRITLDANKDFGNGIAARVAVMGHHNEKAGQNDGAEYKRAGIAPSITFGLDSDTRATLSYYYLKTDDTPDAGVPFNYDKDASRTGGKPVDVDQGIYYGWLDRDFQKQENQIGTLKLEHDLTENFTIANSAVLSKSKNNYIWTQPDDSKGNILAENGNKVWRRANTRITDTETFTDLLSLTGKFNTGAIKHSINAGAEYSKQESDKGSYSVVNSQGQSGGGVGGKFGCKDKTPSTSEYWCTSMYNPNPNDPWLGSITANPKASTTITETQSVYLIDSIALSPKWILDLGVRWDDFDTESVTHATNVKLKSTEDFINYQAGLVYKPVENGSIYASYATSSNPAGADFGDGSESVSATIKDLKAEDVRTMELGTKWDIFNKRANITAAIFRTEKTNTRVTANDGTTQNIGETRVDGFELGLTGNITDKWAASFAYSYLDSEIVDAGFSSVNGAYVPSSSNGNQSPTTPKNSATLWTTYDLTPHFTIGGGAIYSDKVYADAANYRWAPAYTRFDAMARYNVNQNIDLQLNVNNLSDKRYFTKLSSPHYTTEAEGRNAVLSLNFKY